MLRKLTLPDIQFNHSLRVKIIIKSSQKRAISNKIKIIQV